jgi:hypothetical protein
MMAQLTQDCAKHQNVAIHDRCNDVFKLDLKIAPYPNGPALA